jgi:hypothetical protein
MSDQRVSNYASHGSGARIEVAAALVADGNCCARRRLQRRVRAMVPLMVAALLEGADAVAQGRPLRCSDLPEGYTEVFAEAEVQPEIAWRTNGDVESERWIEDIRRHNVQWAVRRCYRDLMVRSPRVTGALRLTVRLAPDGAMRVVRASGPAALAPVRVYLATRIARARGRQAAGDRQLRVSVFFRGIPEGTVLHPPIRLERVAR